MTTDTVNKDLVISYTVLNTGGTSKEYAQLTEALKSGYKVIDIISTAHNTGGGGGNAAVCGVIGNVCITVLLSQYSEDQGVFHQYVGGTQKIR